MEDYVVVLLEQSKVARVLKLIKRRVEQVLKSINKGSFTYYVIMCGQFLTPSDRPPLRNQFDICIIAIGLKSHYRNNLRTLSSPSVITDYVLCKRPVSMICSVRC